MAKQDMDGIRIPPNDLAAERSLLGSLLLDNSELENVRDIVQPNQFYNDLNQEVMQAILDLDDSDQKFDIVTTAQQLAVRGTLEEIGGPPYLMELLETVPLAAHAKYYADIVASQWQYREILKVAVKLREGAYGRDEDAAMTAMAALENLRDGRRVKDKKARPISEHVFEMCDDLDRGHTPTIFDIVPEIDAQIGGTADGEMIVIAGPTSHFKTGTAWQCIDEASAHKTVCGVISEEMSEAAFTRRVITYITPSPYEEWTTKSRQLRNEAEQHFANRAPVILAPKCTTIGAVERQIAEMVRKFGVKLVAVDYAQLIRGEGQSKSEKVADVALRIKMCATKHNIRILLLAGFNRKIYERDDPEPEISDIADSTEIEKSADVILLLFHPYRFTNGSYPDPKEFRIYHRKGRSGGIHQPLLHMSLDVERQKLSPYEQGTPDPPKDF